MQQAKDQKIKLKNGGVVSLDENGNQVVTWTDQTIPNKNNKEGKKNWSNTITVKAKDDFIGGNKIITNGSESGITLENVGTCLLYTSLRLQRISQKVRRQKDRQKLRRKKKRYRKNLLSNRIHPSSKTPQRSRRI